MDFMWTGEEKRWIAILHMSKSFFCIVKSPLIKNGFTRTSQRRRNHWVFLVMFQHCRLNRTFRKKTHMMYLVWSMSYCLLRSNKTITRALYRTHLILLHSCKTLPLLFQTKLFSSMIIFQSKRYFDQMLFLSMITCSNLWHLA